MTPASLTQILALARAGASNHAWELLITSSGGQMPDDPGLLNLTGRLLKDRATRSRGGERRLLYQEAAAAYRRSANLFPSSYPLINAASLSLIAGALEQSQALAVQVLALIDEQPDEPDTPYYRAATRAEALLLLDRHNEARAALAEAIALAPIAWEDHASTLRQFGLLLEAQGEDAAWLDAYRPPRSLHFGGHMSFDARTAPRKRLEEQIATILDEEKIGFGFGALAAGADIIIAEALLSRGAELHAILPGGAESFAATSVNPFGAEWRERFDALLARAETIKPVRPLGAEPAGATIALADEVAMGAAVMNARRLESSAVQLLVLPEDEASASDRSMDRWATSGWRQRLVLAPREIDTPPLDGSPKESARSQTLAVLAVSGTPSGADRAATEKALARLQAQLDTLLAPALPPYWSEARLILAYADPAEAAATAVQLVFGPEADPALRIGGHYGLATVFADPFSGQQRLLPDATGPATAAMDSTPPCTACITEDFAAALAAAGPRSPATEYVGELDAPDGGPPVGLHALKSYDQLFEPLWGDDAQ